MMNYYNSLRSGRDTWLKKDVGDSVGSPPFANSKKSRTSVQWLASLLFLLIGFCNYAQTTLISPTGDGGFANGATFALNGWQVSNSANNPWVVGSAVSATPILGNSAYISNDGGTTNAYTPTNNATNYFWRDVTVPSGESIITLSLNYRLQGEASWDIFQIYTAPTSITPVGVAAHPGSGATTIPSGITGATIVGAGTLSTGVQTLTFSLSPALAGTTFRLIFSWKNETGGTQPPAAIDNISLLSRAPIAPNADPITFSATAVTQTGMSVNWVDNSTNETAFRVYRSTDNITFTKIGSDITSTTVAGTGTTYTLAQTGLSPGTTYYYRIVGVIDLESSYLTGSQATTAGATYYWTGASGSTWGLASNWNTNAAGGGSSRTTPLATDVLIVDGAGTTAGGAVTISVDTASFSIGQFQVTSNTNCTLNSSAATLRTITITGGGGADLVIGAGSTLNLTNATNTVAFDFSGTANTGDISGTYNAGGNLANKITTTGGTGTLVTVSSTGVVNNTTIGSTGCLIGSPATLSFANGSSYTHSTFTTSALLPSATWGASSNATLTGASTAAPTVTGAAQSFGNLSVSLPTLTGTVSFFGANTVVIQGNLTVSVASGVIFRALSSGALTVNGNLNINGGIYQAANTTGVTIINGNTTIASGASLDLNGGSFSQRGASFTNNGNLSCSGTLSFINFTGSFAQTLSGSGTVAGNLSTFSMQNTAGLTITHSVQIPTLRVNLFQGTITGSGKLTLGTGLAAAVIVQIGSAGLLTPGGSFDALPTFNLGTGTYSVIYAQESVARTTGFEIPATRAISALTNSNSNGLTVAGGNLATGTLTFSALSGGNITTNSSNVLTVTGTTVGSVVRTLATAYVNGPLALTLPASLAATTYTFPIGKGTLNPFALVGATTNAGGTVTVQAEVFDADAAGTAGLNISSISTSRYWAASITAGSANFTSALVQLTDTTTGRDAIGASSTANGAYDLQGGVVATNTGTSLTTSAPANTTLPGFFLMANKASASLANLAISPAGNQCTNVARTVTVDVTPGGAAVTGVVINFNINGVAQTAITMTNTTGNGGLVMDSWSGVIPTVVPANASVTWSVTATDGNALTKTQSGTAYSDTVVTLTAAATPNVACVGSTIALAASVVGPGPGTATIGTGVTLTSATTQPTAFCNRWSGYRSQTVYTAAELTAAGLAAGSITSMTYNTTTLGDGATNAGFTVKIGTTALSVLSTSFESTTGYTTVFPSQTYTHTASGLQTITFSTPYVWDGVSNIIIDVIHSGANLTNNAITYYTATGGNTVLTATSTSATTGTQSTQRLNLILAGKVSAGDATANYNWSWDSTPAITAATGNTILPSGASTTYTVTGTNPTTGCVVTGNVSVSSNVAALALAEVTPATSSVCTGTAVTLSAAPTGGCIPYSYSWSDGATVVGTNATLIVSPTSTTTYTVTVTDNASTTVNASSVITVNNPQPSAVAGETKCGTSGSFVLGATPGNVSNTLNWYAAATGGPSLGTGTSFATPTIATSTNYYVGESEITGTTGVTVGNSVINIVNGTTSSTNGGMIFTTTAPNVILNSIDVLVNGTGSMTFQLQDSSGASLATSTQTVTGTTAALTNVVLPIAFTVATPGAGYRILCTSKDAGISWYYQTGTYPYTSSPSGISVTGGYGWSSDTGYLTDLRCVHKINATVQALCYGTRVAVAATLNTPPAFALNAANTTICNGDTSATFSDAAAGADYDTFVISPNTGVFASNLSGVFSASFNPTTTTTYTITASQSSGALCSTSTTFVVNVNVVDVTAQVDAAIVCIGDSINLSASAQALGTGPQTAPTGYAGSGATSTADEEIFNVTFGSINNTSTCSTTGGGSSVLNLYSDYTALTAPTLVAGSSVPLTVVVGTCGTTPYGNWTNVYIDYNRNGTFDPSELAYTSAVEGDGAHTETGTIVIPSNASAGVTRMRVFVIEGGDDTSDPNTTFTWGETEDYNVNILGLTDDTASNTYTWTSDPAGYTATGANPAAFAPAMGTTTYYVTAQNIVSGCEDVSSVMVTVNGDDVDAITGGATSICLGTPTIPSSIQFVSSIGAEWVSSNPTVATIDIATGEVTPLTAGTTTISAKIVNLTTGCTTFAPNTVVVNVYAPLAIGSSPANTSVVEYDGVIPTTATFSVSASGSVSGYQWQVSPTGGTGTFVNVSGAEYSGDTSSTLTISNATIALNGLYYRCEVSGSSPCATPLNSGFALLTVADVAITADPSFTTPICGTGSHTFTVGVTSSSAYDVLWLYSDDNGSNYNLIDGSPVGDLTFSGETTTSLFVDGISSANNNWLFIAVVSSGTVALESNPATVVVNTAHSVVTTGIDAVQNVTICSNAAATSTFTVTSTGGTGYQWQYSANGSTWNNVVANTPTGVTSYAGATTATLTVNSSASLVAGPHYYRSVVAGPIGCPSIDSNTAELILYTPTVNVSASASAFCSPDGAPVTLTASGTASSYSWSPSTGLSATTGASVNASPAVTTTYTVTGTEGACIKTATVTVSAGKSITATAAASPATVCTGGDSQLSAGFTPLPTSAVSGYSFAASAGTYVPLVGGTTSTAIGDDVVQSAIPIGFNFTYNGTVYTDFGISTNGTLKIGTAAPASLTNALASNTNVIAPLWDDNRNNGAITYAVTGTTPNQVLTVQWANVSIGGGGSSSNPTSNYQVQLFEGSNVVKFNYGVLTPNAMTASIGISGALGSYRSVTPASPAASSTSSSATENNAIDAAGINSIGAGTSYTFTPPVLPTYTYSWSPSTFIAGQETLQNPLATGVTAETTYTVTITSSLGCSSSAMTTITPQGDAGIVTQPVSTSVCSGSNATFTAVASGANLLYQWFKNGLPVSGGTNASLTVTGAVVGDSGSTYYLTVYTSCGSPVTTDTVTLTVIALPTVTAPAAWPSTVCSGATTSAITLNGSVGASFNITGGVAIGLADQTGVSAIPSFTGITGTATLVITPTIGTCTGTPINYAVAINALPTAVSVTPATETICSADLNAILLSGSGGLIAPSYCIATTPSQPGASGDYIQDFTFANITNNGTDDAVSDYTYYSALTANVVANGTTTYPISLKAGGTASLYAQQFRIWIDFNQNGVFEASESVFATTTSSFSPATATGSITIPNTALNGTTRMRVASKYSSAVADTEACTHSSYGEYEDYNVSITGGTAPAVVEYVWTSTGGGLFTDLAGTVAYTGTPSSTVYAKPSATATITATYTNAAGCPASGTSVITVNTATATYYADTDGDTYGDAAVSQLACAQPVGYVTNNTDCDDTNVNIYQFATFYVDADGDTYGSNATASVCSGLAIPAGYSSTNDDCDDTNAALNPTNPCTAGSVVNLTLFIEGYYIGGNTMNSVKLNQDYVSPADEVEDLTIELHDATTYALVDTAIGTLKTDGTLQATFNTAAAGSYYIAVKGSNIIETWSAAPELVGTTPLSYDFSSSASQAYEDNMREIETGVFVMYSGDLNQDQSIDNADPDSLFIDIELSNFGVLATDLNGDGAVDNADVDNILINIENSVYAHYPF